MPNYTVSAPDGNSYTVSGPDGATDDQVRAEVLRQNPSAGTPATTNIGPPLASLKNAPPPLLDPKTVARVNAGGQGINAGVASVLGLPGDTLLNLRDLGAAGLGMAQSAVTGKPPSEAFDPVDRSHQWGSSASIERALNALGVSTQVADPTDPAQRYLHAAGTALPGAIAGGPVSTARAVTGAIGGQVVADAGGSPAAQILTQTLANKTGISDAYNAAVRARLQSLEANAAPRVQSAVANAQEVAPGGQTVTQTTASPFLAKLGAGAAGAKTAEASAAITDRLAGSLVDQAKAIAPLGVSNPEVAKQVSAVIAKKDQVLGDRADAIYNAGQRAVAKDTSPVSTTNTVGALDQMLAEAQNPKNLAPPQVSARLQAMIDTLRGKPAVPSPAGGIAVPATPGGTTAAGFMDLGKQINKLYDEVPKDQVTTALAATFARLKAGWHADLAAMPEGDTKAMISRTNDIYSGIMDKRAVLKNSVVASILGKDGKNSISDPDTALARIAAMPPSAQEYTRSMLQTYSPETLDSIRAYAIHAHVESAARGSSGAALSSTNLSKLSPGTLADSGLFTPEQIVILNKHQDAVNTALQALPEKGGMNSGDVPQAAGRIVGGGFNPTFLMGAASKFLTAGKLEQALNTPEGRNAILGINTGTSKTPSKDIQKVTQMYQAALAAQMAQDRQQPVGVGQ